MLQGTQCKLVEGEGQIEVGATRLLGLEGLAVSRVDLPEGPAGRVVHLVTDGEAAAACRACGVVSTSCKGGAVTHPRDLPYGEEGLRLVWHKRRWRCREAACGRTTFTESLPVVPPRARVTTRVRTECGKGIGEVFSCVAAGAAFHAISWPIAHASFIAQVDPVLDEPLPPVEVLGLDETRRGKAKWGQDPVTQRWAVVADRWHTGIVDAHGTGGLVGHVEGRTAALVTKWLREQPQAWRDGITHVTTDLSASYARAVTDALPGAVLVADRFHLVALANAMVTDVRQRVTREALGRRGRKADPH